MKAIWVAAFYVALFAPAALAGTGRMADLSLEVSVDPAVPLAGSSGTITFSLENLGPDALEATAVGIVIGTPVVFGVSADPNCLRFIDVITGFPPNPDTFIYGYTQISPIPVGTTFVCEAPFFVDPNLSGEIAVTWEARVSATDTEINPNNNAQTVVFGVPVAVPTLSPLASSVATLLFLVLGAITLKRRSSFVL
ncbi:MAG: hypothetical protein QNJ40_16820 [Xanthomonadales bacterium]|nr:hypothetical protein [Xanthomonadales bacterium]